MQEFVYSVLNDEHSELENDLRLTLLNILRTEGLPGLKAFFFEDANAGIAFRKASREHAFQFIEEEISRLKEAKLKGTLSAEDLDYAKQGLQPLLDQIEEMCVSGVERGI